MSCTTYAVCVEETVSQTFIINAESPEEARRKAMDQYRNGELTVDEPNVEEVKFSAEDRDGEFTEWEEL